MKGCIPGPSNLAIGKWITVTFNQSVDQLDLLSGIVN